MYKLIKIDNIYTGDYKKFLLNNTSEYDSLINIFKLSSVKIIKNPLVNKFVQYFTTNLDNIIKTQQIRPKGKIFLISDGRYPLSAYMAKDKNIVINFNRRINEYSKYEILSILMYGFTYWMIFNNMNFLKKNKLELIHELTIILYNFIINVFGKHFGAFNEQELLDNCLILCSLFVITILWKEDYKKYYNNILPHLNLKKPNNELIDLLKNSSPINMDIFKWIDLLNHYSLYGITTSFFIDQLMRKYSSEVLVSFESLTRFIAVLYSSQFSSYYGALDYVLPNKEMMNLSSKITKNILGTI